MRLRMLVGVCRSDLLDGRGTPVPIATIAWDVWASMEDGAVERFWSTHRYAFDPGGDYLEYREVDLSIADDPVMEAFGTREFDGVVEEAPDA